MFRSADHTLVFLFTDIEASTRRWERDSEAMADDLARHDKVLRSAIEGAGGEIFSHRGDGLAAAFPVASAALAAAIGGQRALEAGPWSGSGAPRVCMAVHAGTVECRDGNYFGPTLNRLARLLALAHGAQVVCSQAAADLARDDLPSGVGLVDLGEHALADLSRAEHVFQVTASGLPSAFPPLRSATARSLNLPVALTPFVGRAAELQELRRLLTGTRLLTLTGIGGAGKTRLGLELAQAALETFPDGVWFVELSALGDPGLVPAAASSAMRISSEGPPEEQLCAFLLRRKALIVLDNCEHLIDASARLIHTLLEHCPAVSIVATSREVLGLPGETVWRVPPLTLPLVEATSLAAIAESDAVALFCQRARAAQCGFALSETNSAAVARICRRLDGAPLALELAAARLRMLSPHQIAEGLDERFRLLTGGARTAVPRHRTLRAAMDWSYEALTAPERAVLRRLAVFPATFDLEAAEAIARLDAGEAGPTAPGIFDLLSNLVDKSLLVADAGDARIRYRLLETVREYAAEHLAKSGEAVAAHRCHRDYFRGLAVAEQERRGWWIDSEGWMLRTQEDEDNFHAALAWSLEAGEEEPAVFLAASMWMHWYWRWRPEGVRWLERVLAMCSEVVSQARIEVMYGLSMLLQHSGEGGSERRESLLYEALQLAERISDTGAQARGRYLLAFAATVRGDTDRALRLSTEALKGFPAVARAWGLYQLGTIAVAAGDREMGVTYFEHALQQMNDAHRAAHVLAALAPLVGDGERALALSDEAIQKAADSRMPSVMVLVLSRASEAMILTGNVDKARDRVRRLLRLLHDTGMRHHFVSDAVEMAALLVKDASGYEAAARLVGAAERSRETHSEPFGGTAAITPAVLGCARRSWRRCWELSVALRKWRADATWASGRPSSTPSRSLDASVQFSRARRDGKIALPAAPGVARRKQHARAAGTTGAASRGSRTWRRSRPHP